MNNVFSPNIKTTRRFSIFLVVLLSFLVFGLGGCIGSEGQDLLETARFEEKQNNLAHARELYQQIITEYPDSEYAKKAQDRLAQLDATP